MALSDAILPEFDHEMANTRKALERVPDDKFGWKPHEKSGTLGWLAGHLANLPTWAGLTIAQDSFDLAPVDGEAPRAEAPTSREELLKLFDKNVSEAHAAIAAASDAELFKPWALLKGGQTLFSMPKIAVLRGFVMNHQIHHRGQLTVYLRLNDIPVPALYGPSADDDGGM